MTAAKLRALLQSADNRYPVESSSGIHGVPNVTAIQASNSQTDAHIVVLLDNPVQFDSARIASPDRIYFDLHKAQLRPSVGLKTVPDSIGLLKGVRASQYSDEVVRLVLDADGAKEYSAQLMPDPYRLVIDVHSQSSFHPLRCCNSKRATCFVLSAIPPFTMRNPFFPASWA